MFLKKDKNLINVNLIINLYKHRYPIPEILNKRKKPLSNEYFEKWRKPVLHFGDNDKRIKEFFENKLKNINEDEWNISCKIVDEDRCVRDERSCKQTFSWTLYRKNA